MMKHTIHHGQQQVFRNHDLRPRLNRANHADDESDISSLQCGSIKPNPEYNPALDPMNKAFVPPTEITVRIGSKVKGESTTPEWLRLEYPSPIQTRRRTMSPKLSSPSSINCQVSSSPRMACPRPPSPQQNDIVKVNGTPVILSPCGHRRKLSGISVGSIVGQSSLHTSPTESSSSDDNDSFPTKNYQLRRTSFVKREFQHFVSRLKRDDCVKLKHARGCLA